MPDDTATSHRPPEPRAIRAVADRYVLALADLDPTLATSLGLRSGADRLPDLSPAGQDTEDALARATLAELDAALPSGHDIAGHDMAGHDMAGHELAGHDMAGHELAGHELAGDERRCARLLRERLTAGLATSAQGDHLRAVSNIFGPPQRIRATFLDMPTGTADDWAVIARRMARVPQALAEYRASLEEGARHGLLAGPTVVRTVADQLDEWAAACGGRGWFAEFTAGADAAGAVTADADQASEASAASEAGRTSGAGVPTALRADLDRAAAAASEAVAGLGRWLGGKYLTLVREQPDGVGAERYRTCARRWTGADLDPHEAYAWGWSQFTELRREMHDEAQHVLPGASALEAMAHLDAHGEAIDGVEEIRQWLQAMMDGAMADLDGTHFDLAEPIKTVQARIAPPGSAAAPYYTAPSQDFSRPGRTWLPTLGRTRFPLWNLVSHWYHEGVPGHHLQLAQWRYLSDALSMYQTTVGGVSACTEGWALYAERLMDELGYLSRPGTRLGYLDAQMLRAVRVVVDIGMHLRLRVPDDSPVGAGQTWTPDLALAFFRAHSGLSEAFASSEIIRYLSGPGQAISYKLGERAWLDGRDAARAAHSARGSDLDLKSWHMAALSLGSLGLDDLTAELASL